MHGLGVGFAIDSVCLSKLSDANQADTEFRGIPEAAWGASPEVHRYPFSCSVIVVGSDASPR